MIKNIVISQIVIIAFFSAVCFPFKRGGSNILETFVNEKQTNKNQVVVQKSTISSFKNKEYSLVIKSYLNENNKSKLHCVTNQYLIFKKGKKTLVVKKNYLISRTTDKKYLKYVITDVGADKANGVEIYVLKQFAANGEPEYCFVYSVNGTLLFYQKCNRKGCDIKIVNKNKINPTDYFSKNLKFMEVEHICY